MTREIAAEAFGDAVARLRARADAIKTGPAEPRRRAARHAELLALFYPQPQEKEVPAHGEI